MTRNEAERVALRALEKARRWGSPVSLQPHVVEALLTPLDESLASMGAAPRHGAFLGEVQDDPGLAGD